ncbi:hypothetical protein C8F04DRAFT_1183979 [Mycena alexandri]|uniref:Uncharacterized protein n=1 Tax=Mycena alexandri TaxID=1745969 RepID=A0AAD6X1V3_9AGAR|nr:hypothetical protein C8F04DRAFT_1183979 [Mycena alexandri]
MSKRKADASGSSATSSTSASIPAVDASSLKAPWTFFWHSQCFSDIIYYFDQDHIDNSSSATIMPILNTMLISTSSFPTGSPTMLPMWRPSLYTGCKPPFAGPAN